MDEQQILNGNDLDWMVVFRTEGGILRVGQLLNLPNGVPKDQPWAVSFRFDYSSMDNGLPANLSQAEKLEDRILEELKAFGILKVGHWNSNGARTVLAYARSAPPRTISVKVNLFRKAEVELEVREDPTGSAYELQYKPTPLEVVIHRDRLLMEKLASLNDRPEIVRPVDFNCFFKTGAKADQFVELATQSGFSVGARDSDEEGHFVEAVRSTSLLIEEFGPIRLEIERLCEAAGGEFDGWATGVETGD